MSALLVLGSKPDPTLPPRSSFDQVACANGSGFSAVRHGLPVPSFTVMSAVLGAVDSGAQTVQALSGLQTDRLYFLPRPGAKPRNPIKRFKRYRKTFRMQPFHLKWMLRAVSYRYDEFVSRPHAYYADLIKTLCDRHAVILEQIAYKQPSTGIVALAIGLDEYPRERYILSGFSFERTHAYGRNPDIDERGTEVSAHAPTDIAVLRYLAKKLDNDYTTEPAVYENTGVPLLPAQTAKLEPLSARASGAPGPSP